MRGRQTWVGTALLGLGMLAGCGDGGNKPQGAGEEARDKEVAALNPALAQHLPPGATMEMAEEGRKLFTVCAVCHGLDARGNQLGPSLRDQEWIDISGSPEEIQQVIRNGVPEPKEYPIPMPVMGGGDFTDAQVQALTAYVYAISHDAPAPAAAIPADSASAR